MCVIVSGGGLKCWGRNDFGQLGIGSTGDRHSPLDVPGGVNLVFIVCLCVVHLFFDVGSELCLSRKTIFLNCSYESFV
jgi:hypothetical protein